MTDDSLGIVNLPGHEHPFSTIEWLGFQASFLLCSFELIVATPGIHEAHSPLARGSVLRLSGS
jgi:hypothetical protein